ncbi:laccase-like multicopper oxidase [Periconia macrospinosa]|uniref:Laccase-like multicopper oxidase n=1 Tax=Periconia macrospinosa TaxID=97972 RepID=A0A2V1DFU7_9PLEO|nr:laccase-like multicopper oxidase [Periconia macrospinosa]
MVSLQPGSTKVAMLPYILIVVLAQGVLGRTTSQPHENLPRSFATVNDHHTAGVFESLHTRVNSIPDPNNVPNTGKVRLYEFTVSRGTVAPDGVERSAILVNGQFPRPTLEGDWGDTFEITVHNNITSPKERTAIHWHSFTHKGRPWYDGVPAVNFCPIAPGETFVYRFQADMYGSSWWHGHYSAQVVDGFFGAMVINGPFSAPYDIDLGPVILTANHHKSYEENLREQFEVPFKTIFADSNLINGKMFFDCSQVEEGRSCKEDAPISTFDFQPNKTHLLRLINTFGEGTEVFSIDEHNFTVIAHDFVPVEPYATEYVVLGPGQRTDILVKGTGSPKKSYFARSIIPPCDPIHQAEAVAAVYYPGADKTKKPSTETKLSVDVDTCRNDILSKTVPAFAMKPPAEPAVTQELKVEIKLNETGHLQVYMNDVSFRANYNFPILPLVHAGNTSYPDDPQWNVYNFGSNSSIRIVIINTSELPHPIHMHGHNFWVLAEGRGIWDGKIVNPENPARRDTHIMLPAQGDNPAYFVMEFEADNPGVWSLHCHIAWHSAAGMYLNIIERPDEIQKFEMPHEIVDGCRAWWNYTDHEVVNQIDSGL